MLRPLIIITLVVSFLIGGVAPAVFAEGFIDFYVGTAMTRDSDVTVRAPGFSGAGRADWDTSITSGARFGRWLESLPWLGIAVDGSFFRPDDDLTVFAVSPLVLLRLPLLKDERFPYGRLQPYIGAGPGLFISRADGDIPRFNNVSDVSVNAGADVRGGLTFLIAKNFGLFAEYRFTHVRPGFSFDIQGGDVKAKTTFDTHHVLGGVTFRF
jgi:hypothetical protein